MWRMAASHADDVDTWAQCDECSKWRLLASSAFPLPARWVCKLNTAQCSAGPWSCSVPEEATQANAVEIAADGCFVVEMLLGKRKRKHEV